MRRLHFFGVLFIAIQMSVAFAADGSTDLGFDLDAPSATSELKNGDKATCANDGGCSYAHFGTRVHVKKGETVEVVGGKVRVAQAEKVETANSELEGARRAEAGGADVRADRATRSEHKGEEKQTTGQEVIDYRQTGNRVEIGAADYVQHGDVKASNVRGFRAEGDGRITIVEAERIELPDGLLTEVKSYVGSEISFHVGSARDVVLGCITMRQVRDSDFTVSGNSIEIEPDRDVSFHIADCGFSQNNFKAYSNDAKLIISKARRAHYDIEQGELTCHSIHASETIKANTSASVQYGSACFSCVTLNERSTYWYDAEDLASDFGIHIPDTGDEFRLCLKKDPLDYFVFFDGLIDFLENKIVLTKVAELLKYPFKDDEPSSLLTNTLAEDISGYRMQFELDEDFALVDDVRISSIEQYNGSKPIKTLTIPNNLYQLKEQQVGNDTHRLLHVDFRLSSKAVEDARVRSYGTNYFEPTLTIENTTANQNSGANLIRVLGPGDSRISDIIGSHE